jgi:uncharacterized membrane protein
MEAKHVAPPPGTLSKNRIEALADAIFAVAMTLLILDIKLPDVPEAKTDPKLLMGLLAIKSKFVTYFVSFTVLGIYWFGHHIQFDRLHRVTENVARIGVNYRFWQ